MNRKVSYARFHKELFFAGTSELGIVLPPMRKTLDNLEMTIIPEGLLAKFSYKGLKKEVLIPHANIVNLELIPESPKPEIKEKK